MRLPKAISETDKKMSCSFDRNFLSPFSLEIPPAPYGCQTNKKMFPGGYFALLGECPVECYASFCEDYLLKIMPPNNAVMAPTQQWDTRLKEGNIRFWEIWASLNNAAPLRSEDTILEYGVWPGFSSVYISYFVKQVWAIDLFQCLIRLDKQDLFSRTYSVDAWFLEHKKYKRENLFLEYGDIQATRFPDGFFDKVYSFGVHEHIQDDLQALHEINRILKDDGILSMTVDFANTGWEYDDKLLGRCYDCTSLDKLVYSSPLTYRYKPDWNRIKEKCLWTLGNSIHNPKLVPLSVVLKKT